VLYGKKNAERSDMVTKVGLDLGYANISLSDSSLSVHRVPSVAIINKNSRRIVSVGNAAMSYTGEDGMLVRPFKNGIFYSAEFTEAIIKESLSLVDMADDVRCVVGVPDDINAKQEKELAEMFHNAGANECFFVKRAIAALIGAGYSPAISAVSVNVGAQRTEIAVLYRGEIIYSSSEQIGGEDFDEAVAEYMMREGELRISLQDARAIKEAIGAVWEGLNAPPITISGTLALTGNRIKMSVGSEDILGVFEAPLHKLLTVIANAVKKIPTDYVEEIFANGIILSGGGARLFGLNKMIANVFSLEVSLAKYPSDCVARGLVIANSFMPEKMRSSGKNITSSLKKYYLNSIKK